MFEKRKIGGTNSVRSNLFQTYPCISKQRLADSKKGQVTIFIILGILMLLAVILIFLLQKELFTIERDEIKIIGTGTVADFVAECIQDVGEEGLSRAGAQGGYLTVPDRYLSDFSWHVGLSPFHQVPLWANGNVRDQPTLSYIKQEVDEYIEENVRECLFASEAFDKTYDLIENSEVSSDLEFLDDSTVFNVRWNILIQDKAGEVVAEIIEHTAESQVRFKALYGLADTIVSKELLELKLDDITQDLIALDHKDLPSTGLEFTCSQKKWKVDKAERAMRDLLRYNIANLKIKGTDLVEFSDTLPYYQNHYVWDLGITEPKISTSFRFDDTFPFYFQVTPTSGNIMSSSKIGGEDILDFVCIQQWKFTYDVTYPVIVELRDEATGIVFQIAFSVNLVHNFPLKEDTVVRSQSSYSQSDGEAFCNQNNYYVPIDIETYSLIENERTGVYSREPVEDVEISYQCATYDCDIGSTSYTFAARGDISGLLTQVPFCSEAIIKGEKEGYILDQVLTPVQEEGGVIELNLRPKTSIPLSSVSVVKHFMTERDCTEAEIEERGENAICLEAGPAIPLASDETALITLRLYETSVSVDEETELLDINESESESDSVTGSFGSEFLREDTVLFKSEFVVSPQYDSQIQSDELVEFLGGADFEYDAKIYLVDEQDLKGGFSGTWSVPFSSLEYGGQLVVHVLEANPSNTLVFNSLISDLNTHSLGVAQVEFS